MTSGLGSAALVAVLAIVPLVVLMLTSFVKISVVLSLLRNAIGAPEAPSGLVVMGLSLILTFFVMAPVAIDMVHAAAGRADNPAPVPSGPAPSARQYWLRPRPRRRLARGQRRLRQGWLKGAEKPIDLDGAIREARSRCEYRPRVDAASPRALVPAWLSGAPRERARSRTFTGLATRMGRAVQVTRSGCWPRRS